MSSLVDQIGLFALNMMSAGVASYRVTHTFGSSERQKIDWYQCNSTSATVIFLYGGNWQSGDRGNYRFVADVLLKAGYNVAIPDYRLYPSFRFDAIIQDVTAAVRFVLEQLPDDRPVILMGHSAGAMMGALLCLDHQLLGDDRFRINGFIGLSGPYDFYPFNEQAHWELFEQNPKNTQPVNHVRADAPPLYLLHGEDDNRVRRGHSKSLMEKQLEAGGVASREVYKGLGHADVIVQFSRPFRRRSKVVQDVLGFLSTHTHSAVS